MLSGIILAAGKGSRMGNIPKALLKIDDKTFLEIISGNLIKAVSGRVYVVLGYYKDTIKSSLSSTDIKILINPEPERGQLSSLQAAINSVPLKVSAIMVTLVDLPRVKSETYSIIASQWKRDKDKIHVVTHNGRRGHPVIFPRKYFKELLNTPVDRGARAVLHSHMDDLVSVEVNDPYIRKDIDTPEDYRVIDC